MKQMTRCEECGEGFMNPVSYHGRPMHKTCYACQDEARAQRYKEEAERKPINALFATVGSNIQALMDLVRSQAYEEGYQKGREAEKAQAEWLAEYHAATEAYKNNPDL